MKFIGIIPARYGSSRFPGKPLIDIRGKTMIQRTYEQALKAPEFDYVSVATDDERIAENVHSINGNVVMTSLTNTCGTEACLEAAEQLSDKLSLADEDVIVNIQGDEPYVHPESLSLIIKCFKLKPESSIVTLFKKVEKEIDLFGKGSAKVVLNKNGEIIYFSRLPIPCLRDIPEKDWLSSGKHLKQIGMYGYRFGILKKIARLARTRLEEAEELEQLRWIENGFHITGQETPYESFSIDYPEDLGKLDLFLEEE